VTKGLEHRRGRTSADLDASAILDAASKIKTALERPQQKAEAR